MKIIGAGLAGLLAAHAWPTAEVFEAELAPRAAHKALLRFRSDAVAKLTGVDFKPVTVRKGIWHRGEFVCPSIQLANLYAQKVTGTLIGDRSIWDVEPAVRYIAPETFYEQLLEAVATRIKWGVPFDFSSRGDAEPVISTAPFPITLKATGVLLEGVELKRSPIVVSRVRLANADVYQTIYFPDNSMTVYRASITGSLVILEQISDAVLRERDIADILKVFGVEMEFEVLDRSEQKYGKIVPIESSIRKRALHRLTVEHNIYSLGRFATWRNILLDDVVNDIAVIRRMMRVSDYERLQHAANP